MTERKTTALVTGASSGLGREFCRQLAPHCGVIIAVARRQQRLEELARELAGEVELHPIVADLGTVAGVARTVEALRQLGPVDYLVNNAGAGTYGSFEHSAIDQELAILRVHVDASLVLCRAAIGFMRERGGGNIINVASIGAFMPMRETSVYGASKAFLVSFSVSLQAELAGSGINVQCLCPGMTRTEIHDNALFAGFDKSRIPDQLWMETAPVVQASLAALADSGSPVVLIPGEHNLDLARQGLSQQLALL